MKKSRFDLEENGTIGVFIWYAVMMSYSVDTEHVRLMRGLWLAWAVFFITVRILRALEERGKI